MPHICPPAPFPPHAATRHLWVEGNATIYTHASVGGDFYAYGRSFFGKHVALNTTFSAKGSCTCASHPTYSG